jgi:hypothetical protein
MSQMSATVKKYKKRANKLRWNIIKRVKRFDPEKSILLCCNPRGGSTWLLDLIRLIPNSAAIWEPLHPSPEKGAALFRELGFCLHQHIPEDAVWKEARDAFTSLFGGELMTSFMGSATSMYEYFTADKAIIKFCRANALLPWLTKNFSFTYCPIYLVRHPFAVVSSQLKHGAWNHKLSGFHFDQCPYNREYYSQYADYLAEARSKEEILFSRWCLSNVIPLKVPPSKQRWITVYYENLLTNPEIEIDRIFSAWGIQPPSQILNQVSTPSSTTHQASFMVSKHKQLGKWKEFFNEKQKQDMDAILEYFGITQYSSKSIFPQI